MLAISDGEFTASSGTFHPELRVCPNPPGKPVIDNAAIVACDSSSASSIWSFNLSCSCKLNFCACKPLTWASRDTLSIPSLVPFIIEFWKSERSDT